MKSTIYKVTSSDFVGTAYAAYDDGILTMLICEWKPFGITGTVGSDMFPLKEWDLEHSEMFTAKKLVAKSVADKVALFCIKYKQYKKLTYRATKEEKANLKLVTVTEDLLKAYFGNTQYPLTATKSMADYVRHYNTIRDLAANGSVVKVKSRFPEVYDREFERSLEGETLSAYWQHLIRLGWRKVEGTWRSPETL